MTLELRDTIALPPHERGGFDHADVHPPSGRVFVAHTALGQVEILDGAVGTHAGTVPDCPEASGMLYVAIGQPGVVHVVNTQTLTMAETVPTEEGAHTLTFDESRQRLYVFLPRSGRAALYAEVPDEQTP